MSIVTLTFGIVRDPVLLAKMGVMREWSVQAVWMAEHGYISHREADCRLDQYFDFVEQIAAAGAHQSSRALTRQASAEGGAPGRQR